MPRHARIKVKDGIYHTIVRGINRQMIFEEPADESAYLSFLLKYRNECGAKVLAYCLMTNHVHLLIQESDDNLEKIFRKINTAYAMYFNNKYLRTGHLFQDRFKSEVIKDERQLLQTVRYIHRNPVKAGLCKSPAEHRSSSYKEYLGLSERMICDTHLILELLGGEDEFIKYNMQETDCSCMDINDGPRFRISDEEAIKVLRTITEEPPQSFFRRINKARRDALICELKQQHLSYTQICRLTGFSKAVVSRAVSANKDAEF